MMSIQTFRRGPSGRHVRRPVAAAALLALAVTGFGVPGVAVAALPAACVQAGLQVTCRYAPIDSEQTFTVPDGVTVLQVTAIGGAGAAAFETVGGRGDQVTGDLTGLSSGQVLRVLVGSPGGAGGFNGGGTVGGFGGRGGGASDIRTGPSLDTRLLVAGGGGGGSSPDSLAGCTGDDFQPAGDGGDAGSPAAAGLICPDFVRVATSTGAGAGSATAGGAGGRGDVPGVPNRGRNGELGIGGSVPGFSGGAGGGGLYGGGAGTNEFGERGELVIVGSGGGGGGSSLVPAGGSRALTTNPPSVTISYTVAAVASEIAATSGSGQSAQAGQAFAQPLVATVRDGSAGVPVPGAPVTFTVTGGSAAFPTGATATSTADAQGVATAPALTAGSTAGPVTVTATTPGVTGPATFSATVTAAPPAGPARADLSATLTAPATTPVNVPFTATLTVRNAGPSAATTVGSGLTLAAGLRVTGAGGGAVTSDGRSVGFVARTLAPGQQVTYTVRITAAPGTRGGKQIVAATASVVRDPVLRDNAASRTVTVG